MARRGFFAELQHQAKVSAREAQRAQAARARQHAAAVRSAEQAQRAAERAAAQAERAAAADQKRLEKEAREAHAAAMQATVDERNASLEQTYEEIDSLLAATLDTDDFVDLEQLRLTAEHPPFDRPELESPVLPPPPIPDPDEPIYVEPPEPSGLFGKKKKHAEAIAAARAQYDEAHRAWEAEMASLPGRRQAAADAHAQEERSRVERLEAERTRYAAECAAREADVAEKNRELDELIANLGYGTTDAVEEYVSIVLSNSVYPEQFAVRHEFTFDPSTAELALRCLVPGPDQIPTTKAFKYTKASDEITETQLSEKATRDRYAGAVHQTALRSLHEVFEADRRGLVRGRHYGCEVEADERIAARRHCHERHVCLEARRWIDRLRADLERDGTTLTHLGAAVSKNPLRLVPADVAGIRKS